MGALDRLKKGRADLFNKVSKDLESNGKFDKKEEDPRFWSVTRDKAGAGAAIIRFLPPWHEADELPWVRLFSFGFKGPTGKWYINNSLSTIGQADPVGELNHEEWEKSTTEAEKNEVRKRKRKTSFISNIQVIRDPANPENEGKVFLFKYGKQIHDMIMAKAKPEASEFDDEPPKPVFVYDHEEGCNFRLKVKVKDKYPNYEDSKFEDKITPLCGGDEDQIEEVLNQCHKLAEFLDPKNFKSYEELKKELNRALGLTGGASSGGSSKPAKSALDTMDEEEDVAPKKPAKAPVKKKPEPEQVDDDADEDTEFFKNLLKD